MNPTPLLQFDNVTKHFGGLAVITDLSFDVQKGERLALIGPNGAGKSTVFNLISGVYPIDRGRVCVDGVDITNVPSRKRIYSGISRSFQNIRLVEHQTVIENVLLGQHPTASSLVDLLHPSRLSKKRRWVQEAREALNQAGLTQYADLPVGALPYGVRKRVDLVRAVIAKPKLLLLDEPAAGLNPVETDELQRQLQDIHKSGITLLVVEHDMHFVDQLCTRVVVINFGNKIGEGSMKEIRQNRLVREAYLGADVAEGAQHAA
ncbi:ABC transporter ATP-binding protein [Noviherbaspirillum sp.]|jgi:branched-chain amino acid transport system ATP-binding protein|uniref:ABC transporter ATP-binding protein n=1 Tax=Noviherbaspirillum sp. TaxID=1926288 RepID=UPI0025D7F951|nr:ABC transporter ATP-binding protein [Noviherbaspirillum sp.]